MKLVYVGNDNDCNLITGKVYEIIGFDHVDYYYKVIDEYNNISWCYYNNLISLKEYRTEKLKKINESR